MKTAEEALARAESLLAARDLAAAREAFEQARSLGADADHCASSLWQTHMLAGDFASAWLESDGLRQRNAPDPHRFWQGEEIAGKRVMVRCLHGFGDAVQMLRYAPLLKRLASHVVWEVPPRLVPLVSVRQNGGDPGSIPPTHASEAGRGVRGAHFGGVDEVVTWGEGAPLSPPDWEVQLELMELPYLFRTTLADLPLATRYLSVPEHPAMGPGKKARVGLAWSAADWNPSRSIPFELTETLLDDKRIEFWSLQTQPVSHKNLLHQTSVTGQGILPLAQTIAQLDLVITVDTLAAHLAGALGKPAWLLLQYAADWRWLHGRSDSPWYPSLTLFRQAVQGEWRPVVNAVQQRLATLSL